MAENDKKAGAKQEPGAKKPQGKCGCGCMPQDKK
jgi:hypothetical protein